MFIIREPFAAGILYEKDARQLKVQIESCFRHKLGPKGVKSQKIIAGIVPHNSISSSGPIAAWFYSRVEKPNFIILGASHKPMKSQFVIMKEGIWKTPLGELVVDTKMATKVSGLCSLIDNDILAHQNEHSIEMQLPFLQYRFGSEFKILPICIFSQFADVDFLKNCVSLGNALADSIKMTADHWTIIASSDFSSDKKNDKKMINAIMKLDVKKFFNSIKNTNAKICGFGCIAVAMAAAKKLKADKARLLKYGSADVSQASTGYASIIIY